MKIQGVIDPSDKSYPEQYRRMAAAVNAKSRSCISTYIDAVVVGKQIIRYQVPANYQLQVMSLSAIAEGAGGGGANGLTLRLAGGITADGTALTQDVNVLPVAATATDLTQATLLSYAVPGGNTFTVTEQADDHAAAPTVIRLFMDVLIV